MTSYLFNGQWTTDKNERKYRHMSVIPFPVCEFAANHCREGRRLGKIEIFIIYVLAPIFLVWGPIRNCCLFLVKMVPKS